jgi:ClpP class serine protease
VSASRESFTLDARTLASHRAGMPLALAARAVGHTFASASGPKETERRAPHAARAGASRPVAAGTQVAVVSIVGPLAQRADYECSYIDGYDAIAERMIAALDERDVGALVLRVDSPGGDVAGLEEAIRRIRAAREATGKPILAYADELVASAAYWLVSSVANGGVYVPPAGAVGSIGVFVPMIDETQALEQVGLSITLVRDPEGKAAEYPADPIADKALARTKLLVTETAARFYEAVAAVRGISANEVRAFDGAEFVGQAAVDARLVDGVATLEDVLAFAADKARAGSARPTVVAPAAIGPRVASLPRAAMSASRSTQGVRPRAGAAGTTPITAARAASGGSMGTEKIGQACRAAADACTQCADACDGGTADEVIEACGKVVTACQAAMDACKTMSGEPDGDEAPAPPAQESNATQAPIPAAGGVAMARQLAQALDDAKKLRAELLFAKHEDRIPDTLHEFAKGLAVSDSKAFEEFVDGLPEAAGASAEAGGGVRPRARVPRGADGNRPAANLPAEDDKHMRRIFGTDERPAKSVEELPDCRLRATHMTRRAAPAPTTTTRA